MCFKKKGTPTFHNQSQLTNSIYFHLHHTKCFCRGFIVNLSWTLFCKLKIFWCESSQSPCKVMIHLPYCSLKFWKNIQTVTLSMVIWSGTTCSHKLEDDRTLPTVMKRVSRESIHIARERLLSRKKLLNQHLCPHKEKVYWMKVSWSEETNSCLATITGDTEEAWWWQHYDYNFCFAASGTAQSG